MQIVVDSLLTHYEESGQGKAVVFIHGWGDTLESFQNLRQGLSPRFHTVAVDLPGFGQTEPPPATWGLDDYARFIREFLKKVKVEPCVFVCHSNGGAIIMRGLSSGLLYADKLILLASSGIRGQYRGRVKAIRLVTKTGKALAAPLPASVKKRLRRKVYDVVGSDMLVAEHLQETFKKVVTDDTQVDAAKLTLPTLLVYGSDDTATPSAYGQRFHGLIKGSQLKDIKNAGHFVHHDQPELVDKYISEFLA